MAPLKRISNMTLDELATHSRRLHVQITDDLETLQQINRMLVHWAQPHQAFPDTPRSQPQPTQPPAPPKAKRGDGLRRYNAELASLRAEARRRLAAAKDHPTV